MTTPTQPGTQPNTQPLQPASQTPRAIAARLLISLGLLAFGALAFRLSLHPGGHVQRLTQQEALNGATSAALTLSGETGDLYLDTASLGDQALTGTLDSGGTLSRVQERNGTQLALRYEVSGGDKPELQLPLDFWNLNQLGRLGHWQLDLNRALPTRLDINFTSGDLSLNLQDSQLRALGAATQAGNIRAALPEVPGDVSLRTRNGDIHLRGVLGGFSVAQPGALKVQSQTGDLNLDLSQLRFSSLKVGTQTGDVSLELPQQSHVQAQVSSGSGDLSVRLPQAQGGQVLLSSQSGDVSLSLPTLKVKTLLNVETSGDVQVPLNFVDSASGPGSRYLYTPAGAPAGEPALTITIQAGGGDVSVRQKE